ncbi:MAG TPA: tetratricopeptide repeat protein [Steroidobacteraceae bacterium]|nr:tetratricopeptide repeat protein [Steroidobacteraceae bacterium]
MTSRIGSLLAGHARRAASLLLLASLAACATAPAPKQAAKEASQTRPAGPAQSADSDQQSKKFQHAEALYLSGHLQEAAAAFEELTRAYPTDARIWFRYGNTEAKLGAYDDAAKAFQTALAVEPGQGPAALNLALIRLAQAQESLDVAIAGLPAQSPEGKQAGGLKSQLDALVGTPLKGSAPPQH